MGHFGDRVAEAVRRKATPAVVGLDPYPQLLPEELWSRHALGAGAGPGVWARAVEEFCMRVLDVVAPRVAAVKLQSALFEMHGASGMKAMRAVLRKAQRLGLVTIWDAKRGDIAATSEAYAMAAFGRPAAGDAMPVAGPGVGADALTVHPYLGRDSLEPFLKMARTLERGVFVLVRTSNPGCADLEQLSTTPLGQPVWAHVADWVREWSEASRGRSGYGLVGAVVGATAGSEIARLRAAMPHALLLIPGYGAQGACAADVADAFDQDGLGALVSSSRGVLFPRAAAADNARSSGATWEEDIERALRDMISDLADHTPAGKLRDKI